LGSEPLLPPAVDLREDVSLYYIRTPRGLPLGDFREDIPGRHGDIPKYRRANVRVVFAAMATTIRGFSPYRASKLSAVYGSRNAWSPVAKYRAPLDLLWEHLVTYYKMSEVYGIRIVESAEEFEDCLRGDWRLCFLLQLEGAEPVEDPDSLLGEDVPGRFREELESRNLVVYDLYSREPRLWIDEPPPERDPELGTGRYVAWQTPLHREAVRRVLQAYLG